MSDTSSATPELDKQSKIINSGESAAVSDFLDWLIDDQGLGLVKHNVTHEVEMPCAGPSMMTMKECDGGRVKNHRGVDLGACTLCGGTGFVGECGLSLLHRQVTAIHADGSALSGRCLPLDSSVREAPLVW
ncbi:hypothetical protein [Mycobacteroides abscessus]|uniref:hypothetical protein n=1 Tax=Mycobacteroides abscessus TaxID=36809 RepID=UPI0009C4919F|nr:hypothetical protein [Mycobacteroides abscessus]SLH39263.1 Uncharacterised protein [Mycobacteroides abscessus subsp. massiliense]